MERLNVYQQGSGYMKCELPEHGMLYGSQRDRSRTSDLKEMETTVKGGKFGENKINSRHTRTLGGFILLKVMNS